MSAQEQFDKLCDCCGCGSNNPTDLIAEAIERARVVGVLDAWALTIASRGDAGYPEHWACFPFGDMTTACGEPRVQDCVCGDCEKLAIHNYRVTLSGKGGQIFEGPTPDAARAAAAKAIEAGDV